jgi:hypothetical protein
MVRVFKFFVTLSMFLCLFSLSPRARAEDPKVENLPDTFLLKKVAQKSYKLTRITSDEKLKAWLETSKAEALVELEKFLATQTGQELIANTQPANTQAALSNLQDEAFVGILTDTLKQIDRKNWLLVFGDLQAQLGQKNLRIEDLLNNPKIIGEYITKLSEKEKEFWANRAKAQADTVALPITESTSDLSVPTGTFKEGLYLIKALSSLVKIEIKDPSLNNLLIRYFVKP